MKIINAYLNRYGKDIANHVLLMVDSLEGATAPIFLSDFNFFYHLFPKINFYNYKTIYNWFMEEFDTEQKEYKRISKMFEYLCKSLCGIKRNWKDTFITLQEFCFDLQGFDRTGEFYEV